jgi:HD-GYP domain-containing protein (c-di-GMP phosphodiesterase class II)
MGVKQVPVSTIRPGNILADAVLTEQGKILLGKDVVLTNRHIDLLNTWDIQNVLIKVDQETNDTSITESSTTGKFSNEDFGCFVQEYDSLIAVTAKTFDIIRKQQTIPLPQLVNTAGSIQASIKKNGPFIMDYLLVGTYKEADFVTRHSVMVAYFAGIIARQMKWDDEHVGGVTIAGLMHDVGSLKATHGAGQSAKTAFFAHAANLLRTTSGLSKEVVLGIIQHRECIDGSGEPTGVNGANIHPYAKTIAVADTFHNRAFAGDYAKPFLALDTLSNEMFGKLDPSTCHTFITRIRDSLLNQRILLSNGKEAEIIYFHPSGSCMPVVKTINDNQIIDLSQRNGLAISRIIAPGVAI